MLSEIGIAGYAFMQFRGTDARACRGCAVNEDDCDGCRGQFVPFVGEASATAVACQRAPFNVRCLAGLHWRRIAKLGGLRVRPAAFRFLMGVPAPPESIHSRVQELSVSLRRRLGRPVANLS